MKMFIRHDDDDDDDDDDDHDRHRRNDFKLHISSYILGVLQWSSQCRYLGEVVRQVRCKSICRPVYSIIGALRERKQREVG